MSMKQNILLYICLCLFFAACQESEGPLTDITESSHRLQVTIPIGLASETKWNYTTDYVPMKTRSNDFQPALVEKMFAGLVMKEIDGAWYVDTLQHWSLDGTIKVPGFSQYLLNRANNIGKIDLILSPGHYKILVILSPLSVAWNPELKRGYLINADLTGENNVPYACKYRQGNIGNSSRKFPSLYKEVFAGITDFTVSKTGDLHSSSQNGNGELLLTRRVSKYRLALEGPADDGTNFPNTPHYVELKLKTSDQYSFCQGIDCFGKAYYNPEEASREITMYFSTAKYRPSKEFPDETYQLLTPYNSTYPSQYLFIDPEKEEGIPYQISEFHISGQAYGPSYAFKGEFPEQVLHPNSITGLALQGKLDYGINECEVTLKPDRDPARMFSATVELDY